MPAITYAILQKSDYRTGSGPREDGGAPRPQEMAGGAWHDMARFDALAKGKDAA